MMPRSVTDSHLTPVDLHIAYGNSRPRGRIPSSAPGTFSTRRIPGEDKGCVKRL